MRSRRHRNSGGEVNTTQVETVKQENDKIFKSADEAEEYADNLVAENENIISAEVVNVTEVSGVTATQTDFEGYSIDENGIKVESEDSHSGYHVERSYDDEGKELDSYRIVITGGVEEIQIDFAWITQQYLVTPGDTVVATFSIVNESGDDYEIVDYKQYFEGMARYSSISYYEAHRDELGEELYTLEEYNIVVYKPKDLLSINGRKQYQNQYLLSTSAAANYYYPDERDENGKIIVSHYKDRQKWASENLPYSQEDLIAFYNEATGKEHEDAYEAWVDFFSQYGWKTTFGQNGATSESGSDFFNNEQLDLSADAEETSFSMKAEFDGPLMDNLYQMTVINTFYEILTIKALTKVSASVQYTELQNKYSVSYNEESKSYVVTVNGSGEIPAPVVSELEPELTLTPEVTPTPDSDTTEEDTVDVVTTTEVTIPETAVLPAVLGARREITSGASEPAVLGARRAATSDTTDIQLRIVIVLTAASISVITSLYKRKKIS